MKDIIESSYNNYSDSYNNVLNLLESIVANKKITLDDKYDLEREYDKYSNNLESLKDVLNNSKTKIENIAEQSLKAISKDELFDILTDNGRDTIFYKDENGKILINGLNIPNLTLLVQKLNLIATDGEDASSIVLTPEFIQLIADSDIELSAAKILINGLLIGNGWEVDEEGNLDINDLNIRGNLTCESINVQNLISAEITKSLTNNKTITISEGQTISEQLDALPSNLDGYTVDIFLNSDTIEDLELKKHYNGLINIFLSGHFIKGTVRGIYNNACYSIYGGSTETDVSNIGGIMPYQGREVGIYRYSIVFSNCPNINLYNLKVFGDSINTNTVGIGATVKSKVYLENISFVGCKYNVRSYSMAELFCESSSGLSSGNSWSAGTGARITLNPTTQAGGGNNIFMSGNGKIISDGVTFATTNDEGANNTTVTPTTLRFETFSPVAADTYRSTVYNSWKKDNTCRQGEWNEGSTKYGDCNGCWFFGNQFKNLEGKNISKVEINVTRSASAGYSSAAEIVFQAHEYTARPTGAPSYIPCNASLSLAWNESGIAVVTDTTVLNGIKNGQIKGFGIKADYDALHYAKVINRDIKIYYEE